MFAADIHGPIAFLPLFIGRVGVSNYPLEWVFIEQP